MRVCCSSSSDGEGGWLVDGGGGGGGGGAGGDGSVGWVGEAGWAVMVSWAPVTSNPDVELDTVNLFEPPSGTVLAVDAKVKSAVPLNELAAIVKVKGVTEVKSVPATAVSPEPPPTEIVKAVAEEETVEPDGKEAVTVT